MRRSASGGTLWTRRASRRISPAPMRPGGSISPITAAPVSDLPAPDSPTTPSTSPGAIVSDTPSAATSVPWRVGNSTRSPSAAKSAPAVTLQQPVPRRGAPRSIRLQTAGFWSFQFRIQRVAQPIAEQIDRQHQDDQRGAGEYGDPPLPREQEIVADPDQRPQRWAHRRHADAEKRQRRFEHDRGGDVDRGQHQHRPEHVRQQMPEEYRGRRDADYASRLHVLLALLHQRGAAHRA